MCLLWPEMWGQAPMPAKHSGEIQLALKHLQVLGSVLYVAAHPDDENTRLIAYFSQEKGYRTRYLSLTRGDGGQNLIGDEKGSLLGVLRTQELLAARRMDGGEQMFSRAVDFGYSKNPEETLDVWDKEKVLGDVIWAIRKFKPDIIVNRFAGPERGGGGHGHHTASAMLAQQAFHLAADPQAYPEQLDYVDPWQPKRIFWNLYTWRNYQPSEDDLSNIIEINIDDYNPLLGKGYGEIAAEARSKHKCQAFGTAKIRGEQMEKILRIDGPEASTDPMEGVDVSWNRVEGGEAVGDLIAQAYEAFDPTAPHEIVPILLDAYQQMEQLSGYWPEEKLKTLREIIAYCTGLYFEANSSNPLTAQGDTAFVAVSAIKRSPYPISLDRIHLSTGQQLDQIDSILNSVDLYKENVAVLTQDLPVTQHYWLEKKPQKGVFTVDNQQLIGLPETPPAIEATFYFSFGENEVQIPLKTPVVYKYVDRAVGELYRPFIISPKLTANITQKVYLFSDQQPSEIQVLVKSYCDAPFEETLMFKAPEGWQIEPQSTTVSFERQGEERLISLQVTAPEGQSVGTLAVYTPNDQQVLSVENIAYDHIPNQTVFQSSEAKIVKVAIEKSGNRIGYIMGSGDEVPTSLEQIGYQVDILSDNEIDHNNLSKYDAIIAGIRAYNTRERMAYIQEEVLQYVHEGGTYIVQYNTSYGLKINDIGPYPLEISRDRVTVEEAPVTLLKPDHSLFNIPNKITAQDFDGWVQERGLYFPNKWAKEYTALTAINDPDEKPSNGALLIAPYGEGYFIYTGLSFFRELPAGVPGAYRLIANMVSMGKQ